MIVLEYPDQMSLNRDIVRNCTNFKYKWKWVRIKEGNRVRAIALSHALPTMHSMANRLRSLENIRSARSYWHL